MCALCVRVLPLSHLFVCFVLFCSLLLLLLLVVAVVVVGDDDACWRLCMMLVVGQVRL